ncbi:hypothetical protein GYH30_013881 [Glycine max]|nr:hypothetical protein GYH30_013881 [Glycine max]
MRRLQKSKRVSWASDLDLCQPHFVFLSLLILHHRPFLNTDYNLIGPC